MLDELARRGRLHEHGVSPQGRCEVVGVAGFVRSAARPPVSRPTPRGRRARHAGRPTCAPSSGAGGRRCTAGNKPQIARPCADGERWRDQVIEALKCSFGADTRRSRDRRSGRGGTTTGAASRCSSTPAAYALTVASNAGRRYRSSASFGYMWLLKDRKMSGLPGYRNRQGIQNSRYQNKAISRAPGMTPRYRQASKPPSTKPQDA